MASFGVDTRPAAAASGGGGGGSGGGVAGTTGQGALSFLSRGLREDLRLIRARAGELETFLSAPVPEPELFARLRRAYSSSSSSARTRLDLSAFGKAFEADAWRDARAARWRWEAEEAEEWEPVRMVKARLRELERRRQGQAQSPSDMLHKLKLSLKSISFAPDASEDVPPLDLGELLAYFVKQSVPLFDQLGIKRDVCDKLVESLCSKRKDHPAYRFLSASEPSSLRNDNVGDELDLRIASVLQSTGHHYEGGFWSDGPKSHLSSKRHVAIVTTASLPWMTGTAVNPLFRAAYLAKSSKQDVTLVVPWLCKSDQELVYPNSMTFNSPQEQETYMRNWLEERVGFKTDFKISFYPGKFQKERRSIIPAGDTSQFIPSKEADIAILEEPEHLNWYHHGKRWTDKFNHVVGVVHTNYLEYIKREKNGAIQAFFVKHINNLVARAYCHKILRLSGATQDLPKSMICNVHGVNPKFLEVGERIAAERESGQQSFSKGAYFLGKMVWAKGYRELIDLFAKHKSDLEGFKLDIYGNGEDSHEVQSAARKLNLNLNFHKGRDHADDSLHGYKVFINPSISDVLCTATAEALAMGKFVVCAGHPSNDFFRSFPNCLTYKTSEDFVARVKEAMTRDPQPLTPEQRYNLSWEAATQRFMEHSELDKVLNCDSSECASESSKSANTRMRRSASAPNMSDVVDGGLAFVHYCFTGSELLRLSTGAVPGTRNYDKQHSLDLHLPPPQSTLSRAQWSPQNTRTFCQLYVDEIDKGNCPRGQMSKWGWKNLTEGYFKATELVHDNIIFGSRVRQLKKEYNDLRKLYHKETGLGRNADGSISASAEWWKTNDKDNKLKGTLPDYMDLLERMFLGVAVTGETAYAPSRRNAPLYVSSDDDEDVHTPQSTRSKRSYSSLSTRSTTASPSKRGRSPAVRMNEGIRNLTVSLDNRTEALKEIWHERNQAVEKKNDKMDTIDQVIQLAKEAGATEENERQWIGVLMITQNEAAMRMFIKSEAKGRMAIIKHYAGGAA